jgi:crotonobetainyl-CoA:carnitine CoA-transferase CaiB-like acyl-CoA transferase
MSDVAEQARVGGDHPLSGVRVVDASSSYAGPTAAMYLGDLGADVIKIERPRTGDDARAWGPPFVGEDAAWFLSANRNKKSVCLDLSSEAGRGTLRRLLGTSDVFIQNLNPGKLRRAGLHPEDLCAAHPGLICCVISGFGLDGPQSERPGYDLIAQARSGLMSLTGPAGGAPERVSAPVSDVVSGMLAALAISAALVRKERTGRGEVVDVSLLEADLALIAPRVAAFLAGEPEPKPSGATDSVLAVYQTFPTADRPLALAVGNDGMWRRCCEVLELGEAVANDPGLADNAGRRDRRAELIALIAGRMKTRPAQHWLDAFGAAGVPCQPMLALGEVVADEQVRAREIIGSYLSAGGHAFEAVRAPWRLASNGRGPDRVAPALGADTVDVLASAGFSQIEIDALLKTGLAWQS